MHCQMGFSTYLHEWNNSMKHLKMKINQLFNLKLCQLIKIQKQLSSFALLYMKIACLLPFHIVEAYRCLNLSIPSVLTSYKSYYGFKAPVEKSSTKTNLIMTAITMCTSPTQPRQDFYYELWTYSLRLFLLAYTRASIILLLTSHQSNAA